MTTSDDSPTSAESTADTSPRVIIIAGAAPPTRCGIGDYSHLLAENLAASGWDVIVATTAGVALDRALYRRITPLASWGVRDAVRLARLLSRRRPQVIHIQYPGVGYGRGRGVTLLPILLRLVGYRGVLAMTVHEFDLYRLSHRVRIAVGALFCDLVVAPDERVARSLSRAIGWRRALRILPIPVGPSVLPPSDSALAETRTDDALRVGYWGFQRPDKDLITLLKAFDRVRRARPARLILAGDPGPDEEYIREVATTARRLGIEDHIERTGDLSASQLSLFLASIDVCVLPFREGLAGNRTTYTTSVAHGVYVVSTANERQGFDSGSNTAFVRPGNPEAMADAILNRPPARAVHENAKALVTWEHIAELHAAAYRSLTAAHHD